MENKLVRFTKVPLENLITALVALYDEGADFVDIMGEVGPEQDSIGLAVREEYMAPEEDMNDRGYFMEEEDSDLSEEDLNNLI
jgi:hypothetical protein